jgi:hypothetical protein
MPTARVLSIEATDERAFLYRWLDDGTCVGDTWHRNIEDAKHQAVYEFGKGLGTWREVPAGTEDLVAFALGTADQTGS